MKKLTALSLAGLFALAISGPAMAECAGHLKTASDGKGPMTTAMDTQPSTPKPATTKSGS